MVTKEPCSIFSVRLYAPTVSQTVGNTGVTEGFGGDEGALNIHFSEPLKYLQLIENTYQKNNQNTHSEPLIATRVQVRTATNSRLHYSLLISIFKPVFV